MPVRNINVRARPGNRSQGIINVDGKAFRCALGKNGISALKREGDGATPLGRLRVLCGFVRTERPFHRASTLELTPIRHDLGWCDAPRDCNYNRPVRLPYGASHEAMFRTDHLYDVCIVLDWNIRPRRRNGGSAIFLHLARPGFQPSEGCVAVERRVMLRLLPHLSRRTVINVVA